MERDPFKEYLKESEPNKKNKTYENSNRSAGSGWT